MIYCLSKVPDAYHRISAGDGTATLNLSGGVTPDDSGAYDLAIQPNGKIVLGGWSWRSHEGFSYHAISWTRWLTPMTSSLPS